jgi:hypothetical protein
MYVESFGCTYEYIHSTMYTTYSTSLPRAMRSQFLREQVAGEAGRRGSVANLGITLNPLHAKFKVVSLFEKELILMTLKCIVRDVRKEQQMFVAIKIFLPVWMSSCL